MPRITLLLTLLLTAADALGAGRFAVCPMDRTAMPEMAGCGHCPPVSGAAVRDGLPDCCALHAAARSLAAPSEEAAPTTRQGPTAVTTSVATPTVFANTAQHALRPLPACAAALPARRNLPLLR